MAQYFYDEQIKRFLIQFARIFSNWQVTFGNDAEGNPILHRVPIMYGDSSRQAATILANNSSNNLPSAPLITYYVSGFEYDQRRTQDPYFIDKLTVRQKKYDTFTGEWENTQGNAYTVERLMPVPYTLRINVDFWTSNHKQKFELLEQIGVLFNPSMELQSTDNFVDWTSLSVVYQDGLTFSSRTVPVGTGNPIDIMSWKFYMPVWISSSVKIKKFGVIHKIIASIFKGKYKEDIEDDDLLLGTRQKITPYGYKVLLFGNSLQIIPESQPLLPPNSDIQAADIQSSSLIWSSLLNVYGTVRPGISMIALQNPYMETEIIGTINYNPTDDRLLIFTIDEDTLPQNTLEPVNSVIDPTAKYPGENLPNPIVNQRYLIVNSIPSQNYATAPWPGLIYGANENDIIEFNGTTWFVQFDSLAANQTEFVTNLTTNVQYRYTEEGWIKSYEGFYEAGDWRIII